MSENSVLDQIVDDIKKNFINDRRIEVEIDGKLMIMHFNLEKHGRINADPDGVENDPDKQWRNGVFRLNVAQDEFFINTRGLGVTSINMNEDSATDTGTLVCVQYLKTMWADAYRMYPKQREQCKDVYDFLEEFENRLLGIE